MVHCLHQSRSENEKNRFVESSAFLRNSIINGFYENKRSAEKFSLYPKNWQRSDPISSLLNPESLLAFNPNSEIDWSDLMQSLDRKEVLSILVCINRYTLVFPQLLSANIFHQLITFNFGVRV